MVPLFPPPQVTLDVTVTEVTVTLEAGAITIGLLTWEVEQLLTSLTTTLKEPEPTPAMFPEGYG